MTKTSLAAAAEILYGNNWQQRLARVLRVHPRQLDRWVSSRVAVPAAIATAVKAAAEEFQTLTSDNPPEVPIDGDNLLARRILADAVRRRGLPVHFVSRR